MTPDPSRAADRDARSSSDPDVHDDAATAAGAGLEGLADDNDQPIAEVARAIINWLDWSQSGLTPADPTSSAPAAQPAPVRPRPAP
jgi:hypothetical protein